MNWPKCNNTVLSNLNLFLKEMVSLFTYFYGYCQNWKELSIYVVTLHTYYIRNACLCFYGRKLVIESQTDRKTDRWTSQCLDKKFSVTFKISKDNFKLQSNQALVNRRNACLCFYGRKERSHSNCDFVATGIKIENTPSFNICSSASGSVFGRMPNFFKHPASASAEAKKADQVDPWFFSQKGSLRIRLNLVSHTLFTLVSCP